jgi:hypothetical protein
MTNTHPDGNRTAFLSSSLPERQPVSAGRRLGPTASVAPD